MPSAAIPRPREVIVTEQQYVTIAEAAARFGCHPNSIRNWIAAGRIDALRLGPRMIRIDPGQLEQLLRPIPNAKTAA
jgi:excisionase family DNA binding protein